MHRCFPPQMNEKSLHDMKQHDEWKLWTRLGLGGEKQMKEKIKPEDFTCKAPI